MRGDGVSDSPAREVFCRVVRAYSRWTTIPATCPIVKKTLGPDFNVVTAASGETALDAASRLQPALVLLDIMMPGIDGYETCRRLRSAPGLGGTKIILMSARASAAERLEGYAAGADDYVVKPFDPDELLAKVRVYFRLKRIEEVDQVKSDLLTLFNHEVRTPLTCLVGPLDLLAADTELGPPQRELVDMMTPAARRLSALVDQISCLIELKAGNARLDCCPQPLEASVARALARAEDRAGRLGVRFAWSAAGDTMVPAAAGHLDRAIEMIVDNAIRFSPADGTIHSGSRSCPGSAARDRRRGARCPSRAQDPAPAALRGGGPGPSPVGAGPWARDGANHRRAAWRTAHAARS